MKCLSVPALAIVAACVSAAAAAQAQDYPSRVVQIVNPYQAGSTTDVLARGIAAGLSGRLGQQFVVINRPGAGGTVGALSVARADPDGYTLLFAPALIVSVYPAARTDTGYDAEAFLPVCQTFENAMALAVRPDSPFKTLADLVALAREKPGALNYGHQGPSTIPHLAMEEFLDHAKLKIAGIPFRGDPAVMTELLGGRIEVAAVVLGSVTGQNIRVLGVFAETRHPAFPDVQTVKEQGFDVSPTSFGGLLAPARTPAPIIEKLSNACAGAAKDEAYALSAMRANQPPNYYADRDSFRARLARDIEVKKRLLERLPKE
ncbi:MAG TPA: tripartite tricarboxylate transporter substrate binding protein [Xanthobacteraceae bacterium]|jgi:tripartite-type tricarboxylate transporter receptor subunit TctC